MPQNKTTQINHSGMIYNPMRRSCVSNLLVKVAYEGTEDSPKH